MKQFLKEYWPLALIFAACGLIYLVDRVSSLGGTQPLGGLMMVPAEVTLAWRNLLSGQVDAQGLWAFSTLFTYALMHGDVWHILGNMLFIWVFGVLVMRELGVAWLLSTFVVAAIGGGVGQTLLEPMSPIPTLGASGALMGLEGMYFGMALRWRLPQPDVWPIAQPIPQERLMLFAGFGVFLDISGVLGDAGGIAFGAHLGGFISGFFMGTTLIPRPKNA